MQPGRALVLFGSIFAIVLALASEHALATTPSIIISATNATMPTSGTGTISWTLTSVDGFAGQVAVGCSPADPPTGAILPQCNDGSPIAASPYTLTADGTVTGTSPLIASTPPCSGPCPVELRRPGRGGAVSLALASALVLGFSFKRRAPRGLALILMLIALCGLAGMGACGNGRTLTPGTYAYTITANQVDTTGAFLTAVATVNVTVPSGISTNLNSSSP